MGKGTPILITGAGGFIGKNLVANLRTAGFTDLMLFEKDDTPKTLAQYAARAGFVFHLAGINRPKDPSEFYAGNSGLTDVLLDLLAKAETPAPVLVTSSTQAALDNDYGKSKAMAEAAVYAYGEKTGAPVYVFRLPGVFGKWCRPNYNSVVATPSATTPPTACPWKCGTPPIPCPLFTSTTWCAPSSPPWTAMWSPTANAPPTAGWSRSM